MKKIILFFITTGIFINNVNSQITKGNWMVGGSGLFSSQTEKLGTLTAKGLYIKLSPNIGYFFIDKFAGGIKAGLNYSQVKYSGAESKTTQFAMGPFLRYYFLNVEKRINLLTEGSYLYSHFSGNNTSSDSQNAFTFSAGPVVYFNSSVGLEMTLNYEHLNGAGISANTIYFGIGFQIHLEREKN